MKVRIQAKRPSSTTSTTFLHQPVQPSPKHTDYEDSRRDIPTQVERAARLGYSLSRIPIFPPAEAARPEDEGRPLPSRIRQKMERAFGQDFSAVRIHEGPQARALDASAYTQGTDIHFAPGTYQPERLMGQALLGHELTHVVQQKTGQVGSVQMNSSPINEDPALEREADKLGTQAVQEHQVNVGQAHGRADVSPVLTPAPIQKGKIKDLLRKGLGRAFRRQGAGQASAPQINPVVESDPEANLYKPIQTPKLLNEFNAYFPAAADFLYDNQPAYDLLREAETIGATFGGPSEQSPNQDTRPYTTSENVVYVPQSEQDPIKNMGDFLFELNNAKNGRHLAQIEQEAKQGTLNEDDYIQRVAGVETDAVLRSGEIYSQVKSSRKLPSTYDNEFYLSDYEKVQQSSDRVAAREQLAKELLKRPYPQGYQHATPEERYREQFQRNFAKRP